MKKIRNGLDIPISGSPEHKITDFKKPRSVALLGADYHGLKPFMLVKEGDRVKIGQPLFEDKKNKGVVFTSPGGGMIESVNRGEKRALQSVVIEIDEFEEEQSFIDIKTEERVLKFLLFSISIFPVLFQAKGDPNEPPQPRILIFILIFHYI